MANLKQIKNKIKSVGNIKKITRALEVVSTVKLQKTKSLAEALKEYVIDFLALVSQVGVLDRAYDTAETAGEQKKSEWWKKLLIVLSSEKGLCWALNTRIFRKVTQEHAIKDEKTDMFVVGKKWIEFFKRAGANIVWTLHLTDTLSEENLVPLYSYFDRAVQDGAYDEVVLYFNYFKNSILQVPTALRVFPLVKETFSKFVGELAISYPISFDIKVDDLIIEPDMPAYLAEVNRQIRNYVLLSAVVQNKAWEHAARMIAMKNAKDNATTFVKQLTLNFNKARQGAITQEISEIVSAKIAIEG